MLARRVGQGTVDLRRLVRVACLPIMSVGEVQGRSV
jgi:hypothetical protein